MPVPFPDADSALRGPLTTAEAEAVARGVVSAVRPETGLTHLQSTLISTLIHCMAGHEIDAAVVEADLAGQLYDPQDLAWALSRRDAALRGRIVQMMVIGELVLRQIPAAVAHRVEAYAEALGVRDDLALVLEDHAETGRNLAALDFDRNGYLRDFDLEHVGQLHVDTTLVCPWQSIENDPALAARWASLSELPTGTIGRGVHDFYKTRGFTFPGSPGSAPPLLAQHDWVHVLADYGTRVESEIEVFAFIARANDDLRAFSLLAMVISLFETGSLPAGAGLFEASPCHLSRPGMAARFADAMARGAATKGSNDFMATDWFAVADRPVHVLRSELALPPKCAEAVDAGSVGPWQVTGISPFQLNAGRKMAEAEGWEYSVPSTQ